MIKGLDADKVFCAYVDDYFTTLLSVLHQDFRLLNWAITRLICGHLIHSPLH